MQQPAYFFTAGVTLTKMGASPGPRGGQTLQSWDTCASAIVYGADAAAAQTTFENWCLRSRTDEEQIEIPGQLVTTRPVLTGLRPSQ
jgi:hypothetical protein